MNRLLTLAAVLLVTALAPPGARGHVGGQSYIQVPLSHVMPGQTFTIIAADLGSNATISMRLVQGERELDLGAEIAQPDGHFETTRQLPTDFPHGYAQLIAVSDDGSEVSTWVLVGPAENAPPLPGGTGSGEWWLDASVLILAGMLVVGVIALAVVAVRGTRRDRAIAAAPRTRTIARKHPRRTDRRP